MPQPAPFDMAKRQIGWQGFAPVSAKAAQDSGRGKQSLRGTAACECEACQEARADLFEYAVFMRELADRVRFPGRTVRRMMAASFTAILKEDYERLFTVNRRRFAALA
jgi:hypothetical protein